MFPDGRKIAVKLPAYVEDGQTIRLKGQGEQGPGEPGDALVKIRFRRHPRYRVEGRDLHADLPVPLEMPCSAPRSPSRRRPARWPSTCRPGRARTRCCG